MKKKILLLVIIISLLLYYPYYVSYYHLEVSTYTIESELIDQEIHIVMISDVHDQHCKVRNELVEKIRDLSPDLILCVGDMIDDTSTTDQDNLELLMQLDQIAPVKYSIGNHELTYYESSDYSIYKENGIEVLDLEYEDLLINGQNIRIGGMYDYAFDTYTGEISQEGMRNQEVYNYLTDFVDTNSFKIMMAHRPEQFLYGDSYKWEIDLITSGHYHGGQVILPIIGGLYAPEMGWFPKYTEGLLKGSYSKLVITRGISSSNEILPRYNNPGEIVEIVIT